jgi:hypothetical protein
MMGRTPEFMHINMMAMAATGDFFARNRPEFKLKAMETPALVLATGEHFPVQRARATVSDFRLTRGSMWRTDRPFFTHGSGDQQERTCLRA